MTISLPKDLERFVDDAVARRPVCPERGRDPRCPHPTQAGHAGRSFCARSTDQARKPAQPKTPRTKAEFHRHLVEIGLMSQLPDTEADFEDPEDQPIDIPGEPLSETIIRERR